MARICAFYDDGPGADGFARVTRMHHQPDSLAPELIAQGMIVSPGNPPEVREGWQVSLWVNPTSAAHEWRIAIDRAYRMSAAEYMMQLPVATRIASRQAAAAGDLVMQDFLDMLDRMIADNASQGLHPAGRASVAALGYLVQQGWMTQDDMDAVLSPYEG